MLPPPPVAGSLDETAGIATFRDTRELAGTPSWQQAIADADESVSAMLVNFIPAAARNLSPKSTTAFSALLTRMRPALSAAVNYAKRIYVRLRPFVGREGAVCQSRAAMVATFDYPSGHTSLGAAIALVLAELIPDRADAILARGRG